MRPIDERPVSSNDDPSHCGLNILVRGEAYEGYVVIDSIVNHRSAGGVRITEELAIDEVQALAQEMSMKFSLFDLPRGGAKAGLRLSARLSEQDRLAALRDFGRRIGPLIRGGLYYPGMDLNCGPDALRAIYAGAGISLGAITDTSWFTALSVHHCLDACAVERSTQSPRPLTLAVEGFGSVARHLADRLDPDRFQIVAVSTIEGAVLLRRPMAPADVAREKARAGDAFVQQIEGTKVPRESVLTAQADILLPSSRTWVLSPELAAGLQAAAVVPIANAPYARGTLEVLGQRGVLCLPGYLSNVGGVLASSLYDSGVGKPHIERLFAREYRGVVDDILKLARQRGESPVAVAQDLVRLHRRNRSSAASRGRAGRLYDRWLLPRLPGALRASRASGEFVTRMQRIRSQLQSMQGGR
jgi:glutamate dehydrogenase (NAD(P)+)